MTTLNAQETEALAADLAKAPWKETSYVSPHAYIMSDWSSECLSLVTRVRAVIFAHGFVLPYKDTDWRYWVCGEYVYFGGLPAPRDMRYRGGGPFVLNRRKASEVRVPEHQP
ncbi:MAG: hypothetical protein EXR44_02025 [Dehalococcoidia bacterium]|nr:hypothetical protein [Dehalococcoidia bacterium]